MDRQLANIVINKKYLTIIDTQLAYKLSINTEYAYPEFRKL